MPLVTPETNAWKTEREPPGCVFFKKAASLLTLSYNSVLFWHGKTISHERVEDIGGEGAAGGKLFSGGFGASSSRAGHANDPLLHDSGNDSAAC
jgi:hypothetical protein